MRRKKNQWAWNYISLCSFCDIVLDDAKCHQRQCVQKPDSLVIHRHCACQMAGFVPVGTSNTVYYPLGLVTIPQNTFRTWATGCVDCGSDWEHSSQFQFSQFVKSNFFNQVVATPDAMVNILLQSPIVYHNTKATNS